MFSQSDEYDKIQDEQMEMKPNWKAIVVILILLGAFICSAIILK
jgi:hypothetical protein